MATRKKGTDTVPATVLPRMVVVHDDPADAVRFLMDQIGETDGIAAGSLLEQCVALLAKHGTIDDNGGYTLNQNVGPLGWRALVAMSRVLTSMDQWACGDLALAGEKWESVEAVDAIGDVPLGPEAEDAAFDASAVDVKPFNFHQALALLGGSKQTRANRMTVCRKFPKDPASPWYRHRPEWRGALFSHFAIVASVPDLDVVDGWLRKAATPVADGGWTAERLTEAKKAYWRERREESGEEHGEAEVDEGGKKPRYISPDVVRSKYGERIALYIQERVPSLDEVAALGAANAAVGWMFEACPPDVLKSMQEWSGDVDDATGDDGEEG